MGASLSKTLSFFKDLGTGPHESLGVLLAPLQDPTTERFAAEFGDFDPSGRVRSVPSPRARQEPPRSAADWLGPDLEARVSHSTPDVEYI